MKRLLKGITTKYMLIFMALFIVTVFFLGFMITTIVNNYSVEVRTKELSNSNALLKAHLQDKDISNVEELAQEQSEEMISVFDLTFLTNENAEILIADKSGSFVVHAKRGTEQRGNGVIVISKNIKEIENLTAQAISREIIKELSSQTDVSMNSDCDGLFKEKMIWVASALKDTNGSIKGYAISYTNSDGSGNLFGKMIRSISITVTVLLIVSLILIYIVGNKVMQPLKEIGDAAKSFARGKFDVRVPERGNDELTEVARSFNQMAIEIQSKDEMQKQFLSNASHDLRTPMTTIAGFIDGILDGAIPKERQEHYLTIIKNEVQRLSRLVSSLLDISRLQSGEKKFEHKKFNICELARQTIISFEKQFNEKSLDVEFNSQEYDMIAIGDKDAINRVIYNLCHNAIKFSYDGSKYRVSINYTDENKISFSVYNEGVGIEEKDIHFVFDRFYKTDKSRGLDKSGVGLGLFISKTIIDAHEGEIKVESEYGKWCKFTFTVDRGE